MPGIPKNDVVVSADGSNCVPTLLNTKRRNIKIRLERIPVDANNASNKKYTQRRTQRYDRNVRIGHTVTQQEEGYIRKSKRTAARVNKYGYIDVQCSHCKKKFRGDFPIDHYSGNTLCSTECLRKASES